MSAAPVAAVVTVDPHGRVRLLHDDALAGLYGEGTARVQRASHVEPTRDGTGWTADLSPSGGPLLGPFPLRCEALAAERVWLEENAL